MDPQYCSVDAANGKQCKCRRFIISTDGKCSCEHPEGYHPLPDSKSTAGPASAASIVASYQSASKVMDKSKLLLTSTPGPVASSSKPSASASAAAALVETKAGLKRKAPDSDRAEPVSKKGRRSVSASKEIIMGQILLIVYKAASKIPKTWLNPRDPAIANMEKHGLAVNGLRTKLSFKLSWSEEEMDTWFRQNFQSYFAYMDKKYPLAPGAYHWALLIRSNSSLSLSPATEADAKEFNRYLVSTSRADARRIYLLSSHAVPAAVYEHGWTLDGQESESDTFESMEEESDGEEWHGSDSEGAKRRKKNAAGKTKAKSPHPNQILALRAFSITSIGNSESGDFPEAILSDALDSVVVVPITMPAGGVTPTPLATAATPVLVATQPHPTLGAMSSPPRAESRTSRFSNYNIYGTFTSKPFMKWDPSDFEIDPHFWTRPNSDSDIEPGH
ncbi:hypothetical protein B0H11DRAFT_1924513 [Mycena galericulata]|nr:hypothetical protein B0H11DRAFT_1924513 [Mycena galericulata]